jgi:hypothetical protein
MMRMMIHGSGRPAQMPEIVDHIAGKGGRIMRSDASLGIDIPPSGADYQHKIRLFQIKSYY